VLQEQHQTLAISKDAELEGLRRNSNDIKKKQTALEHWKALLLDAEDES